MKGRFTRACAPIALGDGFLHDTVKKKPGEYLSGGCHNRSDRLGMTRLTGSSLMIISSIADPPCGSLLKLFFDSPCPMATTCRVAALVCYVGSSRGVGTSEMWLFYINWPFRLVCVSLTRWKRHPNFIWLMCFQDPRIGSRIRRMVNNKGKYISMTSAQAFGDRPFRN